MWLPMITFWIILRSLFYITIISIMTREYLVFRLKKTDEKLWMKLGSPKFFERDHFFEKYPYRGWLHVFARSSFFDRLALLIFFFISYSINCFICLCSIGMDRSYLYSRVHATLLISKGNPSDRICCDGNHYKRPPLGRLIQAAAGARPHTL